jgi:hexosaminidase
MPLAGKLLCALVLAAGATAAGVPAASSASAGTRVDPAVAAVTSRVVPVPASVRPGGGAFKLAPGTRIAVAGGSAQAWQVGDYAAALLRPSTGYRLPVVASRGGAGTTAANGSAATGIVLALGDTDRSLGQEGYRLRTTSRSVVISARTSAGLFHGVQTLRQLLPAGIDGGGAHAAPAKDSAEGSASASASAKRPATWTVPSTDIRDVPRYAYRSAMLDVSRHFFTVPQVERYIDELSMYKFNTLHLHLTDDQGWRIAMDSWPRLTTYGGSTEVGGGPGGSYSKDDYRAIVRYATDHFLTVVPEIDMPGHTNAALASYAQLNCDGTAPPLYTGTEVGFSSLCVSKDITYQFVTDVTRELAALTPGPYLHIGGDEAKSTSMADYVTFVDRVQPIVNAAGKTVIGWHQIDQAHPAAGTIAQYWGTDGSEAYVGAAARAGTKVIMSPANRSYLDMKYDADTPLGQNWAGYVEVKDSYDWNPDTYVPGVPASAVFGVEAPLWTETLKTSSDLEYMAFPRLPGIAELGWSPASSHDWNAYKVRLATQGPRWDALGINYYRSPQVPWPAA